jgi:hypothetical protein
MIKCSFLASLLFLLVLSHAAAQSPTAKGRALFSGSTSGLLQGRVDDSPDTFAQLNVTAEGGWFIEDGLWLGASAEVFEEISDKDSRSRAMAGLSITDYINTGGTVYPMFSIHARYGNQEEFVHGFEFGLKAGAMFMLSKSVGLTAAVSFTIQLLERSGVSSTGKLLAIPVGVSVIF